MSLFLRLLVNAYENILIKTQPTEKALDKLVLNNQETFRRIKSENLTKLRIYYSL